MLSTVKWVLLNVGFQTDPVTLVLFRSTNGSTTPYITDVTTPPRDSTSTNSVTVPEEKSTSHEANSYHSVRDNSEIHNSTHNGNDITRKAEESHNRVSSPRKKLLNPTSSPIETKKQLKSIAQGHKAALLSRKCPTEPVIAKELTPVQNGALESQYKTNDCDFKHNNMNGQSHLGRGEPHLFHCNSNKDSPRNTQNKTNDKPPTLIASTQTSEKSILEASKIYNANENPNNGKRYKTLVFFMI